MTTQTINLITTYDHEDDCWGLFLEGNEHKPYINPILDGGVIAHDIIEHSNGVEPMGTIVDELEALGGVYFVRGQFDEISTGRYCQTVVESLCRALDDLAEYYLHANCDIKKDVRAMPNPDTLDETMLETLQQAVEMSKRNNFEYNVAGRDEKEAQRIKDYYEYAIHYMVNGYIRKAQSKYEAHTHLEMYKTIENTVNQYIVSEGFELCQQARLYGTHVLTLNWDEQTAAIESKIDFFDSHLFDT